MQCRFHSIAKSAILVYLALNLGCAPQSENPSIGESVIDMHIDVEQTTRPLRCEVVSTLTESQKIFQDDQVEAPWQLYLSIRNSPTLKAMRMRHTIAPRAWIYFYNLSKDPKYILGYYDNSNVVTLGVDGFDFLISDADRKSLTELISKIEVGSLATQEASQP